MNISIVILSFNTKEITRICIEHALIASRYYSGKTRGKTEIIVVDNGSTDGSVGMIKQFRPAVRLYHFTSNKGASVGYNKGMQLSRYEYILLINNDTYLNKLTLYDSVSWMHAHPKADVVIARLTDRNGYFGSYGGSLPTPLNTVRLFLGFDFLPVIGPLFHRIYRMGEAYDTDVELEWIPSCFFFMRREVFEQTGGHDEHLFFYMDDVEWCRRIHDKGFHIWYTPSIQAVHLGGQSTTEKMNSKILLQRQINGMVYYHKKYYPASLPVVSFFMWLGLRLRAFLYFVTSNKPKAFAHFHVRVPRPKIRRPPFRTTAPFALILFIALALILGIRGVSGNPDQKSLNTAALKENGPFELSPERGRFALTYSLVENHSVFFSIPIARFAAPDVGYWNKHFVSLFAPGVSLIVIPGYLLGKLFGLSQVGTFAVISLFALANVFLVATIAEKLGATRVASLLAGLIFLFATPAFAYALNLYQHHISTFLLLVGIRLLLEQKPSWKSLSLLWFICAASIVVDYPNLFFMFPIGIAGLLQILNINTGKKNVTISISLFHLLTFFAALVPLAIFAAFNYYSYGSPTRLSGTVPYIAALDEQGKPVATAGAKAPTLDMLSTAKEQSAINYFDPRNAVNGLYIQLLSQDRGVIYFTPVILIGILGAYYLYKQRNPYLTVLLSVLIANVILYTLWGDPWGGWAFGSRYLIPGYAILAILLAQVLTRWRSHFFLLVPVLLLSLYSMGVNTLGALTPSTNPPKVQVLALEKLSGHEEKYTYVRNYDFLIKNTSKSFFYNTVAKRYMSAYDFFCLISGAIGMLYILMFFRLWQQRRRLT